jgi:DNA-directed RNA polymerase subunit omega
MIEELKEDAIVNKIGGRFKLATLIQKRLIAVNQGARPYVTPTSNDKLQIVIDEIMQDKIFLDSSNNVQPTEEFDGDFPETIDLTTNS